LAETRIRGIDVSHHNGKIDWLKVATCGVDFALAKASEGSDPGTSWYTDPTFATNWQGIKDAGLVRGAYHFVGLPLPVTPKAKWNDDLHRQIDHFFQVVGSLDEALPPVLDFENGDSPLRWQQLMSTDRPGALAIVRELISYTKQQAGVSPIIYTGSFWWDELGDPDPVRDNMAVGDCPLWFAQYPRIHQPLALPGSPGKTDSGEAASFGEYDATPSLTAGTPSHIPKVWGGAAGSKWSFWQFSSFGVLPAGIAGYVDLDVFRGSLEDLQELTLTA
jgi:GH25 family lysozyme M1 (1,4-beta-N-acetylmuramidase)